MCLFKTLKKLSGFVIKGICDDSDKIFISEEGSKFLINFLMLGEVI